MFSANCKWGTKESEVAFRFRGGCDESLLTEMSDWTKLTPSDWVCLLSGVYSSEDKRTIIDALCRRYAPTLIGTNRIVFYYSPATSKKGVVDHIENDLGEAQSFAWLFDDPSWTCEKRFVPPWGSDETFASVFATYDNSGAIIALSVGIERKGCVVRTDPPPAPRVGF